MNALHGLAGPLHGQECFLVDIRRFDRINLLLDRRNVVKCLFQIVLVNLLAS